MGSPRNQHVESGPIRLDISARAKGYLSAAGFDDEISLASAFSPQCMLPDWAAFFIWMGWYVRFHSKTLRIACFVVVPARNTAALFAGLGAQLAGAQLSLGHLDWRSLAQLTPGTEVFMQAARSKNKSGGTQRRGIITGITTVDGQEFVTVRQGDCISSFSVSHAKDYVFSLKPTGKRTKKALHGHKEIYCCLVPEFDRRWLLEPTCEGVIIGDTAAIRRAAQSVLIGVHHSANRFPLSEFLGLKSQEDQLSKLNAISDRYDEEVDESPLCIFNGRQALRGLEHFMHFSNARSFIAILDRAEYDEQANQTALQLRGTADMTRLPKIGDNLLTLPAGIEAMIFPLPT